MNKIAKSFGFVAGSLLLLSVAKISVHAAQPIHELSPYLVEGQRPQAWALPETLDRYLVSLPEGRFGEFVDWETLVQKGASRLEDLVGEIPGMALQSRFGVLTVPTVRGDAAETLFNGQRRGDNLFGMPLSFTPLAGMEIINGTGLLVTGPGKRSGGLMNLVTLEAVPGEQRGEALVRFGTWVPGESSFSTFEGRARLNLSLDSANALAIAAGWRDNATFYHRNGGQDDQKDLYVTWRHTMERGHLDLIGYIQEVSRPQTLGVNRPWQGLIDDGLYITGTVDASLGQADPPGLFDPGIADPGLLDSGPNDLQGIGRDRVLMSRGDVGDGTLVLLQGMAQIDLESGKQFSSALLMEQVHREKLNQFYYAEDVEQLTIDSLTRLTGTRVNALGQMDWEVGVHVRYEERDNLANYWNEFAYAWDITKSRSFNALEAFPYAIAFGEVNGSGTRPWYVPSSIFSTPESSYSEVLQGGTYAEIIHSLNLNWQLRYGLRLDHLDVDAREPAELVEQPLSDTASRMLRGGSVTLAYKKEGLDAYITLAQLGAIAGNTVGDGINLYGMEGLHEADLDNRHRLLEAGLKTDITPQLALRTAAFAQKRQRVEFFASNTLQTKGMELSLDWRPDDRTSIQINAHYLDARYENAAPAEFGGGSIWNVFAVGAGPTSEGTGLGYTQGFYLNSVQPGDHRIPGISRWQTALHIRRDLGSRWDVLLEGRLQGPQLGNLAGEFTIPRQTEVNLSFGYRTLNWEARIFLFNAANAKNWIHNGDTYFDQLLISRNLPRRLEAWIRWWW